MIELKQMSTSIALIIACTTLVAATADVVPDTVPVGNPGNTPEWAGESHGGRGPDRLCGAVNYTYDIGTYEVTAGQYVLFLNAVAADDSYGLYNTKMWSNERGCKIQRSGNPGTYSYLVYADRADRPVCYVSWADAARFCNWMHNGQPSGPQGPGTTEDGSYTLNGATTNEALMTVQRAPGASWVLPSEDEWYKAAYHKNDGITANYYDYPTQSDIGLPPANLVVTPDPGNSANYYNPDIAGFAVGAPYWRSEVGEFENSPSPYGTYDQAGNVWEWTDTSVGQSRLMRGGSYIDINQLVDLRAARRNYWGPPSRETNWIGFRVTLLSDYPSGDLNCDMNVNFDDIDPFVIALVGQDQYETQYPNCEWNNADCDLNGAVNFEDIDPFVQLLIGE